MRLSSNEIKELCNKLGVEDLYSYSRLSTWNTSHWEYYLRYIKHEAEQNATSAYGPCGGLVHEIVEDYYEYKIEYGDMLQRFEDEFSLNLDVLGYRFDRTSEEKNQHIREKYESDIKHFMQHWIPIVGRTKIEEFVTTKVTDDIIIQGYIDQQVFHDNGTVDVIDFKTSTAYSPKSLVEHSAQLAIYSEALHQRGVEKDKIHALFNFLKYAQINYQMVSGKWNSTIVERCELGTKMANRVSTWLKKFGYNSDDYIPEMKSNNTFDNLPEDVRSKFQMLDYYLEVPNPCDLYESTYKQWIIDTVNEINKIKEKYDSTHDETVWYDTKTHVKQESFYFANLCGYSVNQLPQYKEYLDNLDKVSKIIYSKKQKSESKDDDLSWLDELA